MKKIPVLAVILSGLATTAAATEVTQLSLPADHSWQALAVPNTGTIWLGSSQGHVARSVDNSDDWDIFEPGGSGNVLNVRQILALDERQAYALSTGRGERSRLMHTRNGGGRWDRLHRANGDEHLRCFDMIPDGEAWILGDTVNDNWHAVRSSSGSRWMGTRSGFARSALPSEGASDRGHQCVRFENDTWAMGTMGASTARLIYKSRNSLRFQVVDTPVSAGSDSGIHAVYPMSTNNILVAGGRDNPELFRYEGNDFSELSPTHLLEGALTVLKVVDGRLLTGNESGLLYSYNMGEDWHEVDISGVTALSCPTGTDACWAIDSAQQLQQITW